MTTGRWLSREELYEADFPWTIVDGRVYDLSTFMHQHPGGRLISRAVGEDSTELFHTHHTSTRAKKALSDLEIGQLRCANHEQRRRRPFQDVLNARISGLEKAPKTPIAEIVAFVMLLLFAIWATLAYVCCYWRLNIALAWFWWRHLDAGLHGAAHGDFRYKPSWHKFLSGVYSILTRKSVEYYGGDPGLHGFGMSKHLWHHVHTNDPLRDPDWATMIGCPWIRRHESAVWRPFHAFQRRYWLLVTMTLEPLLEWVQVLVSCLEAACALLEVPAETAPPLPKRFAIVAGVWLEAFLNPGYQGAAFLFQPWWKAFGVVFIARALSRVVLFPFSEVQHYMPEHVDAMASCGEAAPPTDEEWAITQLRRTANLRLRNPVARILDFLMFHGDSHQIEHHLWPAMSFVHLRIASQIVKDVCQEFGVPYHEFGYWEGYAKVWRQVCDHALPAASAVEVNSDTSEMNRNAAHLDMVLDQRLLSSPPAARHKRCRAIGREDVEAHNDDAEVAGHIMSSTIDIKRKKLRRCTASSDSESSSSFSAAVIQ